MDEFKAYRIREIEKKVVARFEDIEVEDLDKGEVVVRVAYSRLFSCGPIGRHCSSKSTRKPPYSRSTQRDRSGSNTCRRRASLACAAMLDPITSHPPKVTSVGSPRAPPPYRSYMPIA